MHTRTAPGHGIAAKSLQARIAMVSTHGYVAANPPLGAADTGGQVVYILELSRNSRCSVTKWTSGRGGTVLTKLSVNIPP